MTSPRSPNVQDPAVGRRYAWLCAVRFGLSLVMMLIVLVALFLIDAPIGAAEWPLITAFITVIVSSSGATFSSVCWIVAFRSSGSWVPFAKSLAGVSVTAWLIGLLSAIVIAAVNVREGGGPTIGMLVFALIILVCTRPPLRLYRMSPPLSTALGRTVR